jgi:hypothetical protein
VDRNKFFSGFFGTIEKDNQSVTLILDALRYSIWQQRLNKNNISFSTVELETQNLIDTIVESNPKIKVNLISVPFISLDGNAEGGERDYRDP